MAIRMYEFRVTGFIPGIPGEFAGGSQVLVDEDTNQVIAVGPLGVPLEIPQAGEPEQEHGQGEALPEQQPAQPNALEDALRKLGG